MVKWLKHWPTTQRIRVQISFDKSLKYFVWLGIANSSLIHVFINPDTPCPPPLPQLLL
jgi:hypothetical protein